MNHCSHALEMEKRFRGLSMGPDNALFATTDEGEDGRFQLQLDNLEYLLYLIYPHNALCGYFF